MAMGTPTRDVKQSVVNNGHLLAAREARPLQREFNKLLSKLVEVDEGKVQALCGVEGCLHQH